MVDNKCKFNMDLRKLFSDNVIYIQDYVISSVAEIDNLEFITKRLEQNCLDIGNLVGLVYGTYNGNRFAELFVDYLSCEITFIDSTIDNKIEQSVSDKLQLHICAIPIVDFLAAIDDFERSDLRELFFDNIHLTELYVMARIHKNYSDDIKAFDDLYNQTMWVADFLSSVMICRL
jgi:hypothetical protein